MLKIAEGRGKPAVRSWATDRCGRSKMIEDLRRRAARAGTTRIVFAYEACGFGFRLHDELTSAGIESYVLAPSKMHRSPHNRRRKTDEKDAQVILDIVRAFVLAGVDMPWVWIPDPATRDDRELVRLRLAVREDRSRAMIRIRWLLKRNGIEGGGAKGWTNEYWTRLEGLLCRGLAPGAAAALASLMRQVKWLEDEIGRLDEQVAALAATPRYAAVVAALVKHKGVGVLTAMVYLTEMGDLGRFGNRREVGSYLGLTPSSHESGEASDRKGHITCQGPSRVRKVLCQAVWSRLRAVDDEREAYDRIARKNPKHKKVAVVARMRVLGIRLWHEGLAAQEAMRKEKKMSA